MVEVMKIMATSFKRSHAHTATLSAYSLQQATTDDTSARDSWTLLPSLSQSPVGSLHLSFGAR